MENVFTPPHGSAFAEAIRDSLPIGGGIPLPPPVTGVEPEWLNGAPYTGDYWPLTRSSPASRKDSNHLNFRTELGERGLTFESPEALEVGAVVRWFLWLKREHGIFGIQCKDGTLKRYLSYFNFLCGWMFDRERFSFCELTSDEIYQVKLDFSLRPAVKAGKVYINASSRRNFFFLLDELYAAHRHFGWIPDGLTHDPSDHNDRLDRALAKQFADAKAGDHRSIGRTATIPTDVGAALLKEALKWVNEYSDEILQLNFLVSHVALQAEDDGVRVRQRVDDVVLGATAARMGITAESVEAEERAHKAEITRRLDELVRINERSEHGEIDAKILLVLRQLPRPAVYERRLQQVDIYAMAGVGRPRHSPQLQHFVARVLRTRHSRMLLLTTWTPKSFPYPISVQSDAKLVLSRLITACIIVMLGFSGFRISEVVSAQVGSCEAIEGRIETSVLKGRAQPGGEPTSRPIPRVVHNAVTLYERISASYRTDETQLLIVFPVTGVTELNSTEIIARINQFAKFVNLPKYIDENGEEIEWHFTSMQFRRFFALFYVRRYEGSTSALSDHYRQLSRHVINAYVADPENLGFLLKEKRELTVDVMMGAALGRNRLAGRGGASIDREYATYRAQNLTIAQMAELENRVRDQIETEGLELVPNSYGYCMSSRGRAHGALCGVAGDGLPAEINRTLDLCAACMNGCIAQRGLKELEAEYVMHHEVISSPDSSQAMRDASQKQLLILQRPIQDLNDAANENEDAEGKDDV